MTAHVVDTIDRAVLDEQLADAMRWTPELPPPPTCPVCGTLLPVADIIEIDLTALGDRKPTVVEQPDACPNYLIDDRHWSA